jgi:hypothetical protein
MTRGIPYLIHELAKMCFQNKLTLSFESITDEKGKNTIDCTDSHVYVTLYESDENDEEFAAELDRVISSLRITPL